MVCRVSPGLAGGGIGTIAIILIGLFFGIDPSVLLQTGVDTGAPPQSQPADTNDEMREFVSRVLGSTERTWAEMFQRSGREYQEPRLVLFSGAVPVGLWVCQSSVRSVLLRWRPEERRSETV